MFFFVCWLYYQSLSANCVLPTMYKWEAHVSLPILMLLYIMLYIVLAYLMLFAALSNAVCLYNASFLPMISANAFYFHVLSWFIDT